MRRRPFELAEACGIKEQGTFSRAFRQAAIPYHAFRYQFDHFSLL